MVINFLLEFFVSFLKVFYSKLKVFSQQQETTKDMRDLYLKAQYYHLVHSVAMLSLPLVKRPKIVIFVLKFLAFYKNSLGSKFLNLSNMSIPDRILRVSVTIFIPPLGARLSVFSDKYSPFFR